MSVEPSVIRANTTLNWVRRIDPVVVNGETIASADAADGFSAVYELRSADSFYSITASGSGNEYTVNTSAETTRACRGGQYRWELYLIKDPDRWLINSGSLSIVAYTAGPQDLRSHAKRTLDAIEAMIEGKASRDVQEYTIQTGSGSRSLKHCTIDELLSLKKHYSTLYAQEQAREGKRKSIIRPRFHNNNGYQAR